MRIWRRRSRKRMSWRGRYKENDKGQGLSQQIVRSHSWLVALPLLRLLACLDLCSCVYVAIAIDSQTNLHAKIWNLSRTREQLEFEFDRELERELETG